MGADMKRAQPRLLKTLKTKITQRQSWLEGLRDGQPGLHGLDLRPFEIPIEIGTHIKAKHSLPNERLLKPFHLGFEQREVRDRARLTNEFELIGNQGLVLPPTVDLIGLIHDSNASQLFGKAI